jgi:erythrin-vacuolar iron transport family protein
MSEQPTPDAAAGRGPDKLLAIGAYGETVAAYRYLVLSEKAPGETERREFADMADEEQEHKQRLQGLIDDMYPGVDFVLTPEDKDLVVTGPRLLDVRDRASFADGIRMALETERKTAAFYAQHGKSLPHTHLRHVFHELAEEGAQHYQRLRALARRSGIDSE